MLKIKDNISLDELEKFGFEFNGKEWQYTNFTSEVLAIQDNRCIYILADNIFNIAEDTFGMLYDLIKADMVEKVEN
jgi:hypothetical protein